MDRTFGFSEFHESALPVSQFCELKTMGHSMVILPEAGWNRILLIRLSSSSSRVGLLSSELIMEIPVTEPSDSMVNLKIIFPARSGFRFRYRSYTCCKRGVYLRNTTWSALPSRLASAAPSPWMFSTALLLTATDPPLAN